MAKFADPNSGPDAPLPIQDTVVVSTSTQTPSAQASIAQSMATSAQAQATVGLAQASIDKEIVEDQIKKEDEHWVKAYWRPAMGWLYMGICAMDFIVFPVLSMFLPVVYKGVGINSNYTAWQSLTLSNGGLIHLAFGAILGVTSFMRGQEKLAKIGS